MCPGRWLAAAGLLITSTQMYGAAPAAKGASDKRDLQGIWEARTTANSGLEAHSADEDIRAGGTVIVDPADGKIPWRPEAVAKRAQLFKDRKMADPVSHCYLPGVPRITWMPFPFQIFQTPEYMVITYEYVHASRTIHMGGKHLDDIDFWMGDSRGRWEGDTLVVDVSDLNGETWLDSAGDFHSEALHVTERYTKTSRDTLTYEATVEDPKVFTRPWTIRIPLYRHTEKNAQLYEYECHVYQQGGAGLLKQDSK